MTIGNEDTDDYSDIFFVFLPCITKPTASNLAVFFFFVDIDLTSLMGDPLFANFYKTKHIFILTS